MGKAFDEIKAQLLAEKEKYEAEVEFQKTVKRVYARPKDYGRLTKSVKKAEHLAAGGLDLHKDENRHHSKESTDRWLTGTSYMETYEAMRSQDEYWLFITANYIYATRYNGCLLLCRCLSISRLV